MDNCANCKWNSYKDLRDCRFVSCSHPATIKKTPKFESGDPAWVSFMTSDVETNWMKANMMDCPTWEAKQ